MKNTFFTMSSITYAMKAKEYLNSIGYHCDVRRTPKNTGSGCGYSIVVRDDPDIIAGQLERRNIPYKGIYSY
ncbi:DUF3343 domain-containing protein [uncultured Ruminococcus sp.]|uniref:DUF3343 domain-containing protein n=1 Tax=uncultured Ruminococcus sp. TaxID=165186 RepID=UPI0025D12693|nr:DUF3343 domain-containing protein [uncultured Ruminococcus sp.]